MWRYDGFCKKKDRVNFCYREHIGVHVLIALASWRKTFILLRKMYYFLLEKGGSKAEIVSRRKVIYHKRRQGHMTCTDCICFMAQYVYPSIKNVLFFIGEGGFNGRDSRKKKSYLP